MGENSTTSGLGILKGATLGLSTVSLDSSGGDKREGDGGGFHPQSRQWTAHRQHSEDSTTIAEVPEEEEPTNLQKRLFQQKYNALKVQKEKKKVDRNTTTRSFGRSRDKHFQLPDDVQFALSVACVGDQPSARPVPKIVSEGVTLFSPGSPDGGVTSRSEQPHQDGGTTRREKEVRIVENAQSKSKTPLSPLKRPQHNIPPTPAKKPDNDVQEQTGAGDKSKNTARYGSGKRTPNASQQSKTGSGNRAGKEKHSASKIQSGKVAGKSNTTQSSRVNSGKSEASQSSHTCGRSRSHSAVSTGKPCNSRPTSTSTTSSSYRDNRRVQSSQRRQSKADPEALALRLRRRRRSRVSSGTLSRTGLDSEDSEYFDSDSDFDPASTPNDTNQEVLVYRRACQRHHVVKSRRVEAGLKKGELDVSYSQLTREELKVLCVTIVESVNVTQVDLAGNALPERCLSYLCEVIEENHHIKQLNLSDCQADREGVGSLLQCVQRSNSLTDLDISGIGLCVEQVRIISQYIQNSSALQRLSLSYCEIDETGVTILGDALGSTICLKNLDLSWNQFRHKGALNFCMALKDNDTIEELDLSWNGLGRDGCMGLEVALGANTVLRHLDISSNRIGVQGLEFLLKGLHANTALNTIKLGNNPLPTESGTAVLDTLTNSSQSALCMVDMSHIAVEDEFLTKLTELRKSRVLYVYHGHVMTRQKDPYGQVGNRSLSSFDPILVLFEYMKLQNMRLLDLFRSIDSNADKVISKDELRAVFLSLNMSLPAGTFDAMFHKIDIDHSNTIDMDEMKLVHRRVMRQARALKARAANADDDEFGDVTREFQSLVHRAVARRRSRRSSRGNLLDRSLSPADPSSSDFLTSPYTSPRGGRRDAASRRTSASPRPSFQRLLSPNPPGLSSDGTEALTSLSLDVNRGSASRSRAGSFADAVVEKQ